MSASIANAGGLSGSPRPGSAPGFDVSSDVVIEDLVVAPSLVNAGSTIRILAILAIATVVIAIGLAGTLFERSLTRQAVLPLASPAASGAWLTDQPQVAILEPADGQAISDGFVAVRLVDEDYSGTVRVAVWSGHVVLGSVDIDAGGAGEIDAMVPVSRPVIPLSAVVEVSWEDRGRAGRMSRSVWLFAGGIPRVSSGAVGQVGPDPRSSSLLGRRAYR